MKVVLLDQEVFPDPLELLESAERSVLVVQVELLDHLVNVEPQEEEACLELMDPLDLKVNFTLSLFSCSIANVCKFFNYRSNW